MTPSPLSPASVISGGLAPAGDNPRRFNNLLGSLPVKLPFPGDYGEVQIVYRVQAVLHLGDIREQLLSAAVSELDTIRARAHEQLMLHESKWTALRLNLAEVVDPGQALVEEMRRVLDAPTPDLLILRGLLNTPFPVDAPTSDEIEAYKAESLACAREMEAAAAQTHLLVRRMHLEVIGAVVDQVLWPFEDAPPDPRVPGDWDGWDQLVLSWISSADGGLGQVRTQVQGPLFGRAL